MKPSFVTPIMKELATRHGYTCDVEPGAEYAACITSADGRRRFFRGTDFDLNPLGASMIAKDKDYAGYFLRRQGYRVIDGERFLSSQWAEQQDMKEHGPAAALSYALLKGFPVIVKPNSLSQGSGVYKVNTEREFTEAVDEISQKDRVFLVQPPVSAKDYRVVVLDGEVLSAYERLPLSVVGNATSDVDELLREKQLAFKSAGRDTRIKIDDIRIDRKLADQNLTRRSVLAVGERIFLLDNANLSAGGDAIDVTKDISSAYERLTVAITRAMGLRYCGVDLFVHNQITANEVDYQIIEINAAPGIDNYASVGEQQKRIVEDLYLKVLHAMFATVEP